MQEKTTVAPEVEDVAIVEPQVVEEPLLSKKKQFYKYAAINFAFYITMTVGSYLNVFLESIGFSPASVGRLAAVNSGVGIFSSPFWGTLSDKLRSLRKIIIITLTTGGVLFALIPLFSRFNINGFYLLFLLIPLTTFFRQPVMSLIDTWMLRNCKKENLDYGAIRAYGALSFAIVAVTLGFVVPRTGPAFALYLSLLFTIPPVLIILFVKGAEDHGLEKKRLTIKEMQFGQLFKNYYLVTYIGFISIQRIPFHSAMIFLPFLIGEVGGNPAQVGIVMGVKAAVEIPLMMYLKKLRQKHPLYILIIVATGFFVMEGILLSFATNFTWVIVFSILHGIGNGLMIPCSSSYVFQLAPKNLKATAQTVLASVTGIAGIIGGIVGGLVAQHFGLHRFYLLVGVMLAVALAFFVISLVVGERILKIKRPGLSLV